MLLRLCQWFSGFSDHLKINKFPTPKPSLLTKFKHLITRIQNHTLSTFRERMCNRTAVNEC